MPVASITPPDNVESYETPILTDGSANITLTFNKPINPALEIGSTRLLYKSGGKSGTWIHPDGLPPEVEAILADL